MSDAWSRIPQLWRVIGIICTAAFALGAGYAKLGDIRALEPRIEKLEESVPKIESRQLYQVCEARENRAGRDGYGCRDLIAGDREMLRLLEGNR